MHIPIGDALILLASALRVTIEVYYTLCLITYLYIDCGFMSANNTSSYSKMCRFVDILWHFLAKQSMPIIYVFIFHSLISERRYHLKFTFVSIRYCI